MYTRRFYSSPPRPIMPPPDYSGTALLSKTPPPEVPAEAAISPPPPSLPISTGSEPIIGQIATPSRRTAEDTPAVLPEEAEDLRLGAGFSRRPDLASPPRPRPVRFTKRAPRRGLIPQKRPLTETKRPIGLRAGEEGYRPKRRSAIGAMALPQGIGFETDDLLLLGLLLLFLYGGEDSVREHTDVILLLGFLFFVGFGQKQE